MTKSQPVVVTQRAREAAAEFAFSEGDVGTMQLRYDIRHGKRDDHHAVQILARFECDTLSHASPTVSREEVARIIAPAAWQPVNERVEGLRSCMPGEWTAEVSAAAVALQNDNWSEDNQRRELSLVKADAILALTAQPQTGDCVGEVVRPFAEAADRLRPDDADTQRPAFATAAHYRAARDLLGRLS